MVRRILLFVLVIFLLFSFRLSANEREVAITFDDLPVVFQGRYSRSMQEKIFNGILLTLEKYDVKAAGFVVGKKIKDNYHNDLLRSFVAKGHTLGNHSFSHFDLNKTDVSTYVKDIIRCSSIVLPYIKGVEYYRYPLLHRGNSVEKREAVYKFLKSKDLKIAHVSIDNDEYAFNVPTYRAYRENNREALEDIKKSYLEHMFMRFNFYEKLSKKRLRRSMKHILLLHMNLLNSLFLDELLEGLRKRGWKFVSMEDALKDPVYELKDTYSGPKGVGWMERFGE